MRNITVDANACCNNNKSLCGRDFFAADGDNMSYIIITNQMCHIKNYMAL